MRSGRRELGERWVLWLSLGTLLHSAAASIVLPNGINFATYSRDKTYAKLEWDSGGTCEDKEAIIVTFGELSPESLEGLAWLGLDSAFPNAPVLNHRNGVLSQYNNLQAAIGQKVGEKKEERDCICEALQKAMDAEFVDIILIAHHKEDPCPHFDLTACRAREPKKRKKIFVSGPEGFVVKIKFLFSNHKDVHRLDRPADLDDNLKQTIKLPTLTKELSKKLGCNLPSPICGARLPKSTEPQNDPSGCKLCSTEQYAPISGADPGKCRELGTFCLPTDCTTTTTTTTPQPKTDPPTPNPEDPDRPITKPPDRGTTKPGPIVGPVTPAGEEPIDPGHATEPGTRDQRPDPGSRDQRPGPGSRDRSPGYGGTGYGTGPDGGNTLMGWLPLIIGGVVGVMVLIGLILVCVLCCRRRRTKPTTPHPAPIQKSPHSWTGAPNPAYGYGGPLPPGYGGPLPPGYGYGPGQMMPPPPPPGASPPGAPPPSAPPPYPEQNAEHPDPTPVNGEEMAEPEEEKPAEEPAPKPEAQPEKAKESKEAEEATDRKSVTQSGPTAVDTKSVAISEMKTSQKSETSSESEETSTHTESAINP